MPATDLRARLLAVPGMDRLVPCLEGLPPSFVVGGAVRDLLRGSVGVDLDVAVEGDAPTVARRVAERLGGRAVEHERFGTATVLAPDLSVDFAATRRERYPEPGALPLVEPASLAEDLARRDFSINAMAAGLSGDDLGRLHDPHGGLRDLERGVVRVLHERSFVDDPTRLLRALRYEARLGFGMDPDTETLARDAARASAFTTVSGARTRDELLDLLAEPEFGAALRRLRDLGLDRALHPSLRVDPERAASAALGASETGADRVLAALAALVSSAPDELRVWIDHLGLGAGPRHRVVRAAATAGRLVEELRRDLRPSSLWALLHDEPPEALALALALGAPSEPVLRYVAHLRDVRLEIGGDDLRAAGVPTSPAIGRALKETLRRKLDGEVAGRDDELRVAREAARRAE